jgi:nitrate reductase delta subunit
MKALGLMLAYPDEGLLLAQPGLLLAIQEEGVLGRARMAQLRRFVTELRAMDAIEVEERYVGLFDRSRQVSLYLFEHVHGDSRDRGMAMVNLRDLYASAGLEADARELPDYLPMYLEYLSMLPADEAMRGLSDVGPILQSVHARLVERGSGYAVLFAALLDLAGLPPAAPGEAPPADDTPEALDREWEETAVTFGPENDPARAGGCARADAMLDRMKTLDATKSGGEARA